MSEARFTGQTGREWTVDFASPVAPRGGFGQVFEGESDDGEMVAVKRVEYAGHESIEIGRRVGEREIQLAVRLIQSDAAFLTVPLDYCQRDDDVLLVMSRARSSLAIQAGLPTAEVRDVLDAIAAGLEELHDMDIIHRDLKPANVLVFDDELRLSDFGIAHDSALGTQTFTFRGAGTAPYMAPELFSGNVSATVKSDLYALGVIGYELVHGRTPFSGPDIEDFIRQHRAESVDLAGIEDDVLRSIVSQLMSKDPSGRPQTAAAVRSRLRLVGVPLEGSLDALRSASADRAATQAEAASARAITRGAEEQRESLGEQAWSDLEAILVDAAAGIRQVVPELSAGLPERIRNPQDRQAPFRRPAMFQATLSAHGITMSVELWGRTIDSPVEADPMVTAGEIAVIAGGSSSLIANIVCEQIAGGVRWRMVRFTASGLVRDYSYGPRTSPHGLRRGLFLDAEERSHMVNRVTHVWNLTDSELTAESFLELFAEALSTGPRS